MKIDYEKLSREEWQAHAESAHAAVFDRHRPVSLDRSDYTIFLHTEQRAIGYATVRELDAESVYWQYGGAFPPLHKVHRFEAFKHLLAAQKELGAKRVSTLVLNENVPYLKMCMAAGFLIIGVRCFKHEIYVELLKEL